jgi:bifunctional DNA-binding transcriptional regulator/antitoxin component of YhaV-PrlF toxin-antitoxin module
MRSRITDGWLPIPDAILAALGWTEGTYVDIEVIDGVVILSKSDDQRVATPTPLPKRGKPLITNRAST